MSLLKPARETSFYKQQQLWFKRNAKANAADANASQCESKCYTQLSYKE